MLGGIVHWNARRVVLPTHVDSFTHAPGGSGPTAPQVLGLYSTAQL